MFNNNFKRNHAKHENCNTAIKQNSMTSAAQRQGCGPRPSKLFGGAKNSRRPGQRSALGLHSSLVSPSQPLYYEFIWVDPFTNITFAISTLTNRPRLTFNLSYWMSCTRFSLNFRNRAASGASPHKSQHELCLWTKLDDFRHSDHFFMSTPLSNF